MRDMAHVKREFTKTQKDFFMFGFVMGMMFMSICIAIMYAVRG